MTDALVVPEREQKPDAEDVAFADQAPDLE
jgi:hypothetical protein